MNAAFSSADQEFKLNFERIEWQNGLLIETAVGVFVGRRRYFSTTLRTYF
jgi:hypothetical protein